MDHHHVIPETLFQRSIARFRGGDFFRAVHFANHRADPIGLPPFGDLRGEPIDQRTNPGLPHDNRVDRLTSGRQFVELADIQFAILRQRQRARNRRRRHREHMRRAPALAGQHQALAHPETVLFVDHDHGEIAIADRVLENRVGTHDEVDAAIQQPHQRSFARLPLVAPGQQRDARAGRFRHATKALVMLAGQDFGRGEQRRLGARFHRDEHGFESHDGLACTDIALEKPQHRCFLRHIAFDFGDGAPLRSRQRKREGQLSAVGAVALQGLSLALAIVGPNQHQGKAVGEQFVIRQPIARRGIFALVGKHQRIAPGGPVFLVHLRTVDPFGQVGCAGQRLVDQPCDLGLGQPFRQAIDRLAQPLQGFAVFLHHMIGMNDLQHVAEAFQLARDPPRFAHRQLLFRIIGRAPEIGQRDHVADAILRQHAIGGPRGTAAAMLCDRQFHHDLLAFARIVDILHRAARHEPFGKVVIEIAHPRKAKPVQWFLQLGSNAIESFCLGEEGIENIGTHCGML